MANAEITMYTDSIVDKVNRIVACLDGLSTEEINQPPPVPEANSLAVLAVHTIANVEENILEIIGGEPVGRDRDSEFRTSEGSAGQIQAKWDALRPQILEVLNAMTPEVLDKEYEHARRGVTTGRNVLLVAATHASEHAGHAELTRDWLKSQR